MEFNLTKFTEHEHFQNTSSIVKLFKLNIQESTEEKKRSSDDTTHAFDIVSWKGYELNAKNVIRELDLDNLKLELFVSFNEFEKGPSPMTGFLPITADWSKLPPQDFKLKSQEACQNLVNEWAMACNIQQGSAYYKKMQQIIPIMCASNVPGFELMDMKAYLLGMFIIMMIDDTFDNECDMRKQKIDPKATHQAVGSYCSAFLGDITQPLSNINFPNYIPIFNFIVKLRELLKPYGIENCTHYLNAFMEYLIACGWETEGYSTDSDNELNEAKSLYYDIREVTIGYFPCMELQVIMKKATLPENIRRDPLLQMFNRQVSRHIVVVNDIMSFKKEYKLKEIFNIIILESYKLPMNESFQKAFQQANQFHSNILRLEQRLLEKYPESEALKAYILIGKHWLDSNIQWGILCPRYGGIVLEAHATLKNC